MKYRACLTVIAVLIGSAELRTAWPNTEGKAATRTMAHDIFKHIEQPTLAAGERKFARWRGLRAS